MSEPKPAPKRIQVILGDDVYTIAHQDDITITCNDAIIVCRKDDDISAIAFDNALMELVDKIIKTVHSWIVSEDN